MDFDAKRIYFPKTKNGAARTVPFIGDVEEWLRMAQDDHRTNWPACPYVIQSAGKPTYDPRKAWDAACKAAGLENVWRHDARRSAVRNLDRAGVPQRIAMEISGHKTRHVFDRYNIVADKDLAEAARKVEESLKAQQATESEREAERRVN